MSDDAEDVGEREMEKDVPDVSSLWPSCFRISHRALDIR